MSDTDRRGPSSGADAQEPEPQRVRAVPDVAAAPKIEAPTGFGAAADPREGADRGVGAALAARHEPEHEAEPEIGMPAHDTTGSWRQDAPEPPPSDDVKSAPQSPWSPAVPDAAAEPRSAAKGGHSLALTALALSILLPAGLYGYLSTSGALDRDDSRVARLESSVAALSAQPSEAAKSAPAKPEVTRADLDRLIARLDALDKAVAELRLRQETAQAAAAQAAKGPAQTSSGTAPAPSLAPLTAGIEAATRDAKDALEQAKTAASQASAAEQGLTRLPPLEARIEGLERLVADVQKSTQARPKDAANAPSILVMARAVTSDLSQNLPYAAELDALARLGADPKSVEALRPFAEKGAPSSASLAADFEAELAAARAKVAAASEPTSFFDRSLAMLSRLVRVRHVGADEPGTPAASVENALTRGDVMAARDAWNALPVFEKGATPQSGARITALANAYEAARHIGADALDAVRRAAAAGSGG